MKAPWISVVAPWSAMVLCSVSMAAEPDVRRIEPVAGAAHSRAVIVGPGALAHTAQMLPLDADGRLASGGAAAQLDQVMKNLGAALAAAESNLDRLVKLNLYVADDATGDEVRRLLAERFEGAAKPALSMVATRLPHAALVAADAIAVSPLDVQQVALRMRAGRASTSNLGDRASEADVAILPAGPLAYLSGQAEKGETLAASAEATMDALFKTLAFMGLSHEHVVQAKAFVQPLAESDQAAAAIRNSLVSRRLSKLPLTPVPPLVLVEWTSANPIEIELVVQCTTAPAGGAAIDYLTPTGGKSSPVFSRIARLDGRAAIYFSSLEAASASTAEPQIRGIFDELKRLAGITGSDLRHLAKATYYVASREVGNELTRLRPEYYDPVRPPAASKAEVVGTGRHGSLLAIDMIAAPAE